MTFGDFAISLIKLRGRVGPTYVSVLSAVTVTAWYTTNYPFKGHLFRFSTAAKLVGGVLFLQVACSSFVLSIGDLFCVR